MQTDYNLCDCERCLRHPFCCVRVRQMIQIPLVASCLWVCRFFELEIKYAEEKNTFCLLNVCGQAARVLIPPNNNNKYCTVFPSRASVRHIVHTIALFLVQSDSFYIRRWHRRLPHPSQTYVCIQQWRIEYLHFLFFVFCFSLVLRHVRAYFCIACSVYRSCMSCLSGRWEYRSVQHTWRTRHRQCCRNWRKWQSREVVSGRERKKSYLIKLNNVQFCVIIPL